MFSLQGFRIQGIAQSDFEAIFKIFGRAVFKVVEVKGHSRLIFEVAAFKKYDILPLTWKM